MTTATGIAATPALPAADAGFGAFKTGVETRLFQFIASHRRDAAAQALPEDAAVALRDFIAAGGKRIRPLLCLCGYRAAGGTDKPGTLAALAAALEMFHAFALIHDDVMDRSDTRRGQPTVHRRLAAALHTNTRQGAAEAEQVGQAAAILVGDLALVWSDEILHTAGIPAARLEAILPVLDEMRTEVMYGQYLDVTAVPQPDHGTDLPLRVIRYKTAKYTIERPLHLGALLAGAPGALLQELSAFALPLGEAFQLRDDLLGVFGTPLETGKSHLDDLRDGKHTVLIALAQAQASRSQGSILRAHLGDPDLTEAGAAALRATLTATGAPAVIEQMIADRYRQSMIALDGAALPAAADQALRSLARTAVWRHR